MRIRLVPIGNSKGLRLTKAILKRYAIKHNVELLLGTDYMILKPVRSPREGWHKAFQRMAERGDDVLLLPDVFADEDCDA
jgi:antitoxin MazE